MSIASEITRLQQAKSDLATSIANKGVTVPAATTIDGYAALVDQIQQGGGTLPYDSEIEYLESTGTQWIDTGINPNTNTKVQIKFRNITATSRVIIGYHYSTQGNANDGKSWRFFNYGNTIYFDIPSGTSTYKRISGGTASAGTDYEFEFGNHYVKNIPSNTNILTGTSGTFTGDMSITLNNYNYTRFSSNRFYYMKIYKGSTLVRDLIPVRVGQDGYMYDKVSETLFGNLGTGSFTLGPDVT